jgi:hypothetical protein
MVTCVVVPYIVLTFRRNLTELHRIVSFLSECSILLVELSEGQCMLVCSVGMFVR